MSKVGHADLSQVLRIAAEFKPFQEIDVHAKVAGYVKRIYVDVGDRVRRGQTLAVLEVPELEHSLAEAEASSRKSAEDVARAHNELQRVQADHTVAHLSYSRLEEVIKARPQLIAQQEVDEMEGKDQSSEAQVAAAKSALAAAQEQLRESNANRERVQALLDYSHITAPFDGVITERYADTGAMLAAGTTSEKQALSLVKLSENGLLRLQIPIPEADVPSVRMGTKVTVDVQALHKEFQGVVARFSDEVDPSTRTMMTEVDVPNPKLEIVPGMYAYVSFPVQERKKALAANIQAISLQGDKAMVYLVSRDNTIEIRAVTTGLQTQDMIEVLSGLMEGDRVVVGNTSQLREGQHVVPKLVQLAEMEGGR
ncbi:MAG: efflux RND transporter periplasmic adaptor subunit [Terriglobia bacterium]